MRQITFRLVLGLILLVSFSLSCNIISRTNEVRSTAEGVATRVEQGRGMLGTGQALATQVGESGYVETAQALATQVGESGLKETAQAYATQFEDSGYLETAQAVSTQFSLSPENVPSDIPLYEGEKNAFVASPQVVSYFIDADFDKVLAFYQREMPARGWIPVERGTVVTENTAELNYEKDGRTAMVVITTIPYINQTTIVISLQNEQ
jgi:hypothetical protein